MAGHSRWIQAAREAALEAEKATRATELAEDARRMAELTKLRLSATPSVRSSSARLSFPPPRTLWLAPYLTPNPTAPQVRSLALCSAMHTAPAIRFAMPAVGEPLRLTDRSWWKVLHLLEADGLTPPLKGTELATVESAL